MTECSPIYELCRCDLAQARQFVESYGVHQRTAEGVTSLGCAARNPDWRVVELFLTHGIDPRLPPCDSYSNYSVYMYAVDNAESKVLATLLAHGVPIPALELDVILKRTMELEYESHFALLVPFADVYLCIHALQIALEKRALPFIRSILDTGFDILSRSERPPHYWLALFFDVPEIVGHYNINVNRTDAADHNICHHFMAQRSNDTGKLQIAIQCGVDIHAQNYRGSTVVDLCFEQRQTFETHAVLFLAGACPSYTLEPLVLRPTLISNPLARDAGLLWRELLGNRWQDITKRIVIGQANAILRRVGVAICIGLQSLDLPALVTCEILQAYCHMWPRIPFHCCWNLVTTVKHFQMPEHTKKKRRVVD